MPWTEQGREVALAKLAERRADPPERVDNASMPAGAPMYFYCIACGHLSDTKPESYVTPVRKLCGECAALQALDWLE